MYHLSVPTEDTCLRVMRSAGPAASTHIYSACPDVIHCRRLIGYLRQLTGLFYLNFNLNFGMIILDVNDV